ncbi:MAG: hypothetical protein NTX49_01445 [Chlamydiae bacterium]|nr:hypothetical protein [Chlamydiota bacterium]
MKIESSLITVSTNESFIAEESALQDTLTLGAVYIALSRTIETILSTKSSFSEETYITDNTFSLSPSDIFHFGYLWDYIKDNHISLESVAKEIETRRSELSQQKNHWRDYAETHRQPSFSDRFQETLRSGHISPCPHGCGSAYFLYDVNNVPQFVIKPVDEDIFCLNNRKHFACPFIDAEFRVRQDIPLYRSAQTDVLCSQVAAALGIPLITPKTEMWILNSQSFYDLSMNLTESDKETLMKIIGNPDFEKLCSVQEYVPGSIVMIDKIYEWIENGDEDLMGERVCPQDFEDANIFVWTTYDNDAHPGNFLFYPKEIKEDQTIVYGIKKVDNGLSFPEKNTDFTNFLMYFDSAKDPLSDRSKEKIKEIPIGDIVKKMQEMELSIPAITAFVERVRVLQELAKRNGISTYEINLRMMLLSLDHGVILALGNQKISDLEKLIGFETIETSSEISTYSESLSL